MRLKSRQQCPPNAFQFTIPKINVWRQHWDFNGAVTDYYNISVANPSLGLSTDREAIANLIDEENARRCLTIKGAEIYTMEGGQPYEIKKAESLPSLLQNVADKSKAIIAGAELFKEWIGEGGIPVEHSLAESRSGVCVNCPKNEKSDFLSMFTKPAAELIRKTIELKNNLELKTSNDDKVGICSACLCSLKLKPHTPLVHILKFMSPEIKAKLHPSCWILSEMK